MRNYGFRIMRWVLRILAAMTLLIVLAAILIQLPFIQTKIITRIVDGFSEKTATVMSLEKVSVRLTGSLALKGVYIEDQAGDTLLYAGKIGVKLRLWPLMRNHIDVRGISLSNIAANIRRAEPDTVFNYDFLVQSFKSDDDTAYQNDSFQDDSLLMTDTVSENEGQQDTWSFTLDNISLKDANVHFFDYMDGVDVEIVLSHFSTGLDKIDPSQSLFHVGNATLNDLFVSVTMSDPAVEKQDKDANPDFFPDIDLVIQKVDFEGIKFVMSEKKGDPEVFEMDLQADNLLLKKDTAALDLVSLTGNIMDQVHINSFSGGFAAGKTISLENLALETADSYLNAKLIIGASLEEVMAFFTSTVVETGSPLLDIYIERSRFGHDLSGFLPDNPILKDMITHHEAFHLKGRLRGHVDDLTLEGMEVNAPGLFELALYGQISGLPNMDRARFFFPEVYLSGNTKNWKNISVLDSLSDQFQLPPRIKTSIHFNGTYRDFLTDVAVTSDFGGLHIEATYKDLPGALASYESKITLDQMMLGEIVGLDMLEGGVSGVFDIRGSGLTVETMDVNFGVNIHDVFVNQYHYTDLSMQGDLSNGLSTFDASYHDENLSFTMLGEVSLKEDAPAIKSEIDLMRLDGRALHLTEDTFLLKTSLSADLTLITNDFFDGMVHLTHTDLLFGDQTYVLDSLAVWGASTVESDAYANDQVASERTYSLEIRSGILDADYQGNTSPLSIQSALENHISSYFGTASEADMDSTSYEKFSFSFTAYPSKWYTGVFLPELESFDKFSFEGAFDAGTGLLDIEGLVPEIIYGGVEMNELSIHSVTDLKEASLEVKFERIHFSGMEFTSLSTDAIIENRKLQLSLWADKTIGDPWLAASGDLDEIEVVFNHSELEKLFSRDAMYPLFGNVDGKVLIRDVRENLSFIADMTISKFGYSDEPFGDVSIHLESQDLLTYSFDASIMNFGNQLEASGRYSMQDDPEMDVSLFVRNLALSSLEIFTSGQIRELEGIADGDVRVWGPLADLNYSGSLSFRHAKFLASFVNVHYSLPDETILFERNQVNFKEFSLLDQKGRSASLSGTINTADFFNPVFDLKLTSENFLALQLDPGQNALLSGQVLINSNLSLRGDLQRPIIDGSLKLNEGSSFTMNLPQSKPEAIGDEGIVLFLPADSAGMDLSSAKDADSFTSSISNLDVSINVEVDPKTNVRINIDEYAGDYLRIKGGGMISYGMDPGGRISLSGRYELLEGTYLLTFYDVLSRQFNIVRGSNIMWAGDPTNPEVDIRAVYNIRTSARELFVTSSGAGDLSDQALRQTFPFQVFLEMKGTLKAPQISFDIELPPDQQNAMDGRLQSRLNQLSQNESELNKQVFALLAIGGFLPDNPLEVGTEGPGISSAARSSASRLLTQQLNRLSDQYIRGVDIQFDVESFEEVTETGYRGSTQLNLEVSKDFFDERLRVTVGGNIELEDESKRNTSAGDIAGDFSIEYVMIPSGNLVLKGFRKKEFDDLFEGQVIETGVALLYNRTYNRLKELFTRKEEKE